MALIERAMLKTIDVPLRIDGMQCHTQLEVRLVEQTTGEAVEHYVELEEQYKLIGPGEPVWRPMRNIPIRLNPGVWEAFQKAAAKIKIPKVKGENS